MPLYTTNTASDMYADDATFYTANKDPKIIKEYIQTDLGNINQNSVCVTINNNVISSVDSHKLLVVHIDNKLTWDSHVSHLCKAVAARLALLLRLKI